ncbi:MAG: ATP-binding protein, partial [Gammaproteobacteria bacterium]|nr:ATP-binding protein [Gammaproteobacteria bacterium]
MNEDLVKMLKYLRLTGLLTYWDDYIKEAQKGNYSHVRLLGYIIEQEYKIKKENSTKMRLKRAKIEEEFVIETYPFDRQPKLNKKKVLYIYDSFDYIQKKQNIIWLGPTGTGKTGLATSFLIQAINNGYTGRAILFPELIEILYRARGDYSEEKAIRNFASYDCLHIDEMGYVEMEPIQVGQFFTLMHKRHKKKTTLITSNLGFSQWNSFFKNSQLTAALIDRLLENSHVINMKNCTSLR